MNEVYRTRRQWFIRDFMIQTQRPASELATFLEAFDSCDVCAVTEQPDVVIPEEPEKSVKPKTKPKTNPVVVHNEVTKNVHPRAKMVMAEFEGRNTYYGSIAAAAHALNCSQAQLSRALKLGKTINGTSVITVTPEEVFQLRKKEQED